MFGVWLKRPDFLSTSCLLLISKIPFLYMYVILGYPFIAMKKQSDSLSLRISPIPGNLHLFGHIFTQQDSCWKGEWAVDCERGWGMLTSKILSGASEQKTGSLLGTLTIIKVRRKLSWKSSIIPSRTEQPFPFAPLHACWGDPAISSLALLLYLAPQPLWTLPGKVFLYI